MTGDTVALARAELRFQRNAYARTLQDAHATPAERERARDQVAFALEHYEAVKPKQALR